MEIDLSTKCRACLSDENEMHYLFSEFDQGFSLAEILQSLNFEVLQDDGSPPFLCQNCTTIVIEFFNFKSTYSENEQYLKSLFNNSEVKTEEVNTENVEEICITEVNDEQHDTSEEIEADYDDNKDACSFDDNFNEEKHLKLIESVNIKKDHLAENKLININYETEEIIKYVCFMCQDSFLLKHGFQQHMLQKHNIYNFDFKEYVTKTNIFNKKEELNEIPVKNTQIKKTHKPYICHHCGHSFKRKSDLIDHSEVHSDEKKYTCPFCGKSFKRRTVLVKHKRLHTHPREAICELCGKAFNEKGTLKTHIMLLHEKTRNFRCEQCGLAFPLKSTLEKHILRHNPAREREYTCHVCYMAYKDKSSLNRHVAVKHSKDNGKLKCECGKEYSTTTNLMKHQLKHHAGNQYPNLDEAVLLNTVEYSD